MVLQLTRTERILATGSTPSEALSITRFLKIGMLYPATWSLWLAPVLGLLGLGVARVLRARSIADDRLNRMVVTVIALAIPIWATATRWVWHCPKNWPSIARLSDRYRTYVFALGIVVALGAAQDWMRGDFPRSRARFISLVLVASVCWLRAAAIYGRRD